MKILTERSILPVAYTEHLRKINFSLDDILWTSTTIRKSPKE